MRVFSLERDNAIKEVGNNRVFPRSLLPRLAGNVVMVKKDNGKWRICMDFIDLNKVCSKDSYPLLRIDHLIDQ